MPDIFEDTAEIIRLRGIDTRQKYEQLFDGPEARAAFASAITALPRPDQAEPIEDPHAAEILKQWRMEVSARRAAQGEAYEWYHAAKVLVREALGKIQRTLPSPYGNVLTVFDVLKQETTSDKPIPERISDEILTLGTIMRDGWNLQTTTAGQSVFVKNFTSMEDAQSAHNLLFELGALSNVAEENLPDIQDNAGVFTITIDAPAKQELDKIIATPKPIELMLPPDRPR